MALEKTFAIRSLPRRRMAAEREPERFAATLAIRSARPSASPGDTNTPMSLDEFAGVTDIGRDTGNLTEHCLGDHVRESFAEDRRVAQDIKRAVYFLDSQVSTRTKRRSARPRRRVKRLELGAAPVGIRANAHEAEIRVLARYPTRGIEENLVTLHRIRVARSHQSSARYRRYPRSHASASDLLRRPEKRPHRTRSGLTLIRSAGSPAAIAASRTDRALAIIRSAFHGKFRSRK